MVEINNYTRTKKNILISVGLHVQNVVTIFNYLFILTNTHILYFLETLFKYTS